MNALELIRRDRDLFEMWLIPLVVRLLLGVSVFGAWFFWLVTLIRAALATYLLSRAAQGKAWGRVVFGVLVGYEAVMLPMISMRPGTPGTERSILGIKALAMSYVFLRAFRVIGRARVPQEIG